jgi:hypothetical protein
MSLTIQITFVIIFTLFERGFMVFGRLLPQYTKEGVFDILGCDMQRAKTYAVATFHF